METPSRNVDVRGTDWGLTKEQCISHVSHCHPLAVQAP